MKTRITYTFAFACVILVCSSMIHTGSQPRKQVTSEYQLRDIDKFIGVHAHEWYHVTDIQLVSDATDVVVQTQQFNSSTQSELDASMELQVVDTAADGALGDGSYIGISSKFHIELGETDYETTFLGVEQNETGVFDVVTNETASDTRDWHPEVSNPTGNVHYLFSNSTYGILPEPMTPGETLNPLEEFEVWVPFIELAVEEIWHDNNLGTPDLIAPSIHVEDYSGAHTINDVDYEIDGTKVTAEYRWDIDFSSILCDVHFNESLTYSAAADMSYSVCFNTTSIYDEAGRLISYGNSKIGSLSLNGTTESFELGHCIGPDENLGLYTSEFGFNSKTCYELIMEFEDSSSSRYGGVLPELTNDPNSPFADSDTLLYAVIGNANDTFYGKETTPQSLTLRRYRSMVTTNASGDAPLKILGSDTDSWIGALNAEMNIVVVQADDDWETPTSIESFESKLTLGDIVDVGYNETRESRLAIVPETAVTYNFFEAWPQAAEVYLMACPGIFPSLSEALPLFHPPFFEAWPSNAYNFFEAWPSNEDWPEEGMGYVMALPTDREMEMPRSMPASGGDPGDMGPTPDYNFFHAWPCHIKDPDVETIFGYNFFEAWPRPWKFADQVTGTLYAHIDTASISNDVQTVNDHEWEVDRMTETVTLNSIDKSTPLLMSIGIQLPIVFEYNGVGYPILINGTADTARCATINVHWDETTGAMLSYGVSMIHTTTVKFNGNLTIKGEAQDDAVLEYESAFVWHHDDSVEYVLKEHPHEYQGVPPTSTQPTDTDTSVTDTDSTSSVVVTDTLAKDTGDDSDDGGLAFDTSAVSAAVLSLVAATVYRRRKKRHCMEC